MKHIGILVRKMLYKCADTLSHGDDALILAAYYGRLDMVRYLLSLRRSTSYGDLLIHAVGGDRLEVLRYLLSCYELHVEDAVCNALTYAIKIGNKEMTELLLSNYRC